MKCVGSMAGAASAAHPANRDEAMAIWRLRWNLCTVQSLSGGDHWQEFMFWFADRVSTRLPFVSQHALSFAPLAGLSARDSAFDPVLFISGMAVLSAGLVVLRASHAPQAVATPNWAAPAPVVAAPRAPQAKKYTADEALAERELRASDREVLLSALAAAAETFYSIAGHLPRDVSDKALGKADDLRELVWLNRTR